MYPKHFLDYFREFETTDEVFVAMPFRGEAANRRWEKIFVPAIEAVDLEPYRVDARDVGDSILTDILNGIGRARLVLGDVSGQGATNLGDDRVRRPNPNAVYELGIAHAARLETEVVVVRAESEESNQEAVPFDLLHIRHHSFYPQEPEDAGEFIADLLDGALKEIERTRDLVLRRVVRRLDDDAVKLLYKIQFHPDPKIPEFPKSREDDSGSSMSVRRVNAFRRLLELGLVNVDEWEERWPASKLR